MTLEYVWCAHCGGPLESQQDWLCEACQVQAGDEAALAKLATMQTSGRPTYRVRTWDADRQAWTPQRGVRVGPYTQYGLRRALRKLREMGYDTGRDAPCVLVERDGGP